MRILYIGSILSIHDFKLAEFFSKNNKNDVYFTDGNSTKINELPLNIIQKFNEANINILESISHFSLKKLRRTLKSKSLLKNHIKKYKIDVVHISFAAPHSIWGLFINCPKVLTTHGSDVLVTIPQLKKNNFHDKILHKLFCIAFQSFDAIISTSQKQADLIKEQMGIKKKIEIINVGVDIEKIQKVNVQEHLPEKLHNKNFIFFPRYLEPKYNHELEIAAFQLLNNSIKRYYLMVFIEDHSVNKEYIVEITNKLRTIEELHFEIFGHLTQEEMFCCYRDASLTVMVPLSDGTPITALEAMSAKCPLLLGTADYDKQIFENACLKLKNNSPEELAHLIETALANYPSNLIERAENNVKLYGNMEIEMNKVLKIYSACR